MNATPLVGPRTDGPKRAELAFHLLTIDCVACSPGLYRNLTKIPGVLEVRDLSLTNRMVVVCDAEHLSLPVIRGAVLDVAKKAGLEGKVLFT